MPRHPSTPTPLNRYRIPFVLVTSLFFLWGLANNMTDTLLAAFKKIMSMTDAQTSWIQVAFYGSYFCLALPAAWYIKRFSYKSGILLGLGLFAVGGLLFYPASQTMVYGHFLAALFILAGGLSILETTANPYILSMGDDATATRRLNLAQAFNPIGSITGVALSKLFILSGLEKENAAQRAQMSETALEALQARELSAVMGPYVGLAIFLLLMWVVMALYPMPAGSDDEKEVHFGQTLARLVRNRRYLFGVIAQFFYVGAQIGIWSYTIRYVMQELNLDEEAASEWYIGALVLFLASRFIFTFLMQFISPARLLMGLAALATAATLGAIFLNGFSGVIALTAISGCMSLMFPTIFGLASEGLGADRKVGGSGLIMGILGGAVFTLFQGQISDSAGIHMSFVVPLICFVVVAAFGFFVHRTRSATAKQP